MSYLDDPRVYFAAERTLLAWIRTAITLMAFGFVIARFGIFVAYLSHGSDHPQTRSAGMGLGIGVALVLLGSAACVLASRQFRRFLAELGEKERPVRYLTTCGPWAACLVAAIGVLLSAYLVYES